MSPTMDIEPDMLPEMDDDQPRSVLTLPDRNEFPAEFVFRLHRNDARDAATGFLGFIIIRTPNFHKLIERGFILEEDYILSERSRIYSDGDFVPDKWDERAKSAHHSLVCRRVWPIKHLAYRYSGEIRLYSDKEDRLAVTDIFSGDVWAWATVAEVNGYFDKDEGGKIYNYVADWVRQPFDGRERRNWCLIPEVMISDPDERWWCWRFNGAVYHGN